MIDFDFEYYKPQTIKEATGLFSQLEAKGKHPIYYSGGTEILTIGRLGLLNFGSVIDLKGIPACRYHNFEGDFLVTGACLTLNEIHEQSQFPLLGETVRKVADHTSRNKITIGGNVCGNIIYKEALLPFLITDSWAIVAGAGGFKKIRLTDLYDKTELKLEHGEVIVQFLTERHPIQAPFFTVKKRKFDRIDYPLVTVAAIKIDGNIRVAFSGLLSYPFRSKDLEEILNNPSDPEEVRIDRMIERLPGPVRDDWLGSAAYRQFVLKNTLLDMFEAFSEEG